MPTRRWRRVDCFIVYLVHGSAIASACTQIYNSRANRLDVRNGGLPNVRPFEGYSYRFGWNIAPHGRHDDLNTEVAQIADIDPVEAASIVRWLIDNRVESCPRYNISVIECVSHRQESPEMLRIRYSMRPNIFLGSPVSWTAGRLAWAGDTVRQARHHNRSSLRAPTTTRTLKCLLVPTRRWRRVDCFIVYLVHSGPTQYISHSYGTI